jgi:hypothetical protein
LGASSTSKYPVTARIFAPSDRSFRISASAALPSMIFFLVSKAQGIGWCMRFIAAPATRSTVTRCMQR